MKLNPLFKVKLTPLSEAAIERMEGLSNIRKEIKYLYDDGFEPEEIIELCKYIIDTEVYKK